MAEAIVLPGLRPATGLKTDACAQSDPQWFSPSQTSSSSLKLTAKRRYQNGPSHNSSVFFGRTDYNKESVRRKTFQFFWPSEAGADPSELVAAGLYYTGDSDVTKCFSCGVSISDWKADDNVMGRHRETNPNCPFVNGTGGGNVMDFSGFSGRPTANHMEYDKSDDRTKPQLMDSKYDQRTTVPKKNSHHKKFGNMKEERNRIRTFDHTWAAGDLMPSVEDIAAAGLYFSGNERRVVCPFCGSQVDLLNPLCDPLEEHRKKSANCSFLKSLTQKNETSKTTDWKEIPAVIVALGMNFEELLVHRAVKRLRRNKVREITSSVLLDEIFNISDEEGSASESEDEEEEEELSPVLLKLKEKNDKLRSEVTCKRCHISRVDTLLLPCGHVSMCEDCAEDTKTCPISTCGKKILGTVKTFLI